MALLVIPATPSRIYGVTKLLILYIMYDIDIPQALPDALLEVISILLDNIHSLVAQLIFFHKKKNSFYFFPRFLNNLDSCLGVAPLSDSSRGSFIMDPSPSLIYYR